MSPDRRPVLPVLPRRRGRTGLSLRDRRVCPTCPTCPTPATREETRPTCVRLRTLARPVASYLHFLPLTLLGRTGRVGRTSVGRDTTYVCPTCPTCPTSVGTPYRRPTTRRAARALVLRARGVSARPGAVLRRVHAQKAAPLPHSPHPRPRTVNAPDPARPPADHWPLPERCFFARLLTRPCSTGARPAYRVRGTYLVMHVCPDCVTRAERLCGERCTTEGLAPTLDPTSHQEVSR